MYSEESHSGRVRSLGKRVWCKPSQVQILSLPPQVNNTNYNSLLNHIFYNQDYFGVVLEICRKRT